MSDRSRRYRDLFHVVGGNGFNVTTQLPFGFLIASACFADRLKQAGIEVDYRNYAGVAHEFFGMGAVVDVAKQAEEQAAEGLKRGFAMKSTAATR